MRLQEVYFICQSLKENWQDLSFEERKINGGFFYKLSNLSSVKSNLKLASEITSFKQVVKNIENYSPGFNVVEGEVVLDPRGRNAFSADYNQLNLKITTIIDLFDSFNYKQSDNGFDIKLPPEITLSELGKCSKDLDQIFSTCPLLSRENATISLSSVDVGSIWLSFLVGGTAIATVLSMVAVLIDKALIIRSHYLTTKTQMETYRSIKLSNDMIERMEEVHETASKQLLETHCKELCEKYDVKDPEDFERMKNSLHLLSDWMSKGLEIHAAIKASPEVKAVFPPLEKQLLSTDEIALLSEQTGSAET